MMMRTHKNTMRKPKREKWDIKGQGQEEPKEEQKNVCLWNQSCKGKYGVNIIYSSNYE